MAELEAGLEKELSMLHFVSIDNYRASSKHFFEELIRCLNLALSPKYRLFKQEIGYFNDTLFFAIYYGDKYDFRYVTYLDNDQVVSSCWLYNKSIRVAQKNSTKNTTISFENFLVIM